MLDFQLRPFAQVFRALDQELNQNFQNKAQSFWTLEEDEKNFYLLLDTPGVRKEDIDIETVGQELIIKWSSPESKRKAIAGGVRPKNFEHRFKISDQVDLTRIDANYSSGVLELRLGKRETSISRKILISDTSLVEDNLKN